MTHMEANNIDQLLLSIFLASETIGTLFGKVFKVKCKFKHNESSKNIDPLPFLTCHQFKVNRALRGEK